MDSTDTSRVEEWVNGLRAVESEFHNQLAENFSYYISHVNEFESGAFEFTDLPAFDEPQQAAMHAAVNFGLAWATTATLHLVLTDSGEYIDLFGIRENAERVAGTDESFTVQPITPSGRDPADSIQKMQNGQSEILPKVGNCMEFLLRNESAFESGDPSNAATDFPHFNTLTSRLLAYSALFGKLWEYSDPALWIIKSPDNQFKGLYADNRAAAEAQHEFIDAVVEPVTPRDNDRQSNVTLPSDGRLNPHPK